MSKDKILKTTVNLYAHYGIRGVSMSQIAGALQISKKTLYAEFGNKQDLLIACIDSELERINRVLDSTEREAINPIDAIILLTSDLLQYRSYYCPAFYRDLNRFHEAYRKVENYKMKLIDRYYNHFQKGKEEGFFQPDFDYEAMACIFLEQLSGYRTSHQSVTIFTFLRGICTEKGIKAVGNYSPGTIKKHVYDYN